MTTSRADEPRLPSYAKCRPCGHVWIFGYVPAPVAVFVRQMKRATCPMCGATSKHIDAYEPGAKPADVDGST